VSFPHGLTTITVTGENVLGLDGLDLNGVVIFTASEEVADPAASVLLDGAAVGNIASGVLVPPLVIPTTDCVSPPFTYTITLKLQDADGIEGGPPPLAGVEIPSSLGATVDLSALL
jgi:hypothetical protein